MKEFPQEKRLEMIKTLRRKEDQLEKVKKELEAEEAELKNIKREIETNSQELISKKNTKLLTEKFSAPPKTGLQNMSPLIFKSSKTDENPKRFDENANLFG